MRGGYLSNTLQSLYAQASNSSYIFANDEFPSGAQKDQAHQKVGRRVFFLFVARSPHAVAFVIARQTLFLIFASSSLSSSLSSI